MIWVKFESYRFNRRPTHVDCTMCGGTTSLDNCNYCADTGLDPIPRAEVMSDVRNCWYNYDSNGIRQR